MFTARLANLRSTSTAGAVSRHSRPRLLSPLHTLSINPSRSRPLFFPLAYTKSTFSLPRKPCPPAYPTGCLCATTSIRCYRTKKAVVEEEDDEQLGEDALALLDPEVEALRSQVYKLHGKVSTKRHRRAQIINRKLVEESLEKVDLKEWEGCQLIDMNPGFGLFSKAIHEKVRPSRHILLEPNVAFHPILKEKLIDNLPIPGHKCEIHVLSLDGYEWSTHDTLIAEKLLIPTYIPPSEGVNTNILFVGNLAMKGNDGDRMATQLVESIGTGTWVQQHGRVRMMVWMPDSHKIRFLPRVMRDRTRMTVLTELCADVQELAGAGYYDEETTWQKTIDTSLEKLLNGLAELQAKRDRGESINIPGITDKQESSNSNSILEETVVTEGDDEGNVSARLAALASPHTRKQAQFNESDKESFLGIHFRHELESLYAAPGHEPWTPELEHPPWVYESPDLNLPRPPPRPSTVKTSTVGRTRRDGTRGAPKVITEAKKLHQPLTQKTLRRLPFPNEYVLKNGYDAWQLIEAYQNQKFLDQTIAQWDAEATPPIDYSVEDPNNTRNPLDKHISTKEQYMLASQAIEMGYRWTTMAKAGIIWKDLEKEFGPEEAYVWMKAVGQSKRKRALIDVLREELAARRILQWHKRKFNPIKTKREDVQPKEPIAFLDFIPKRLPPWLEGEKWESVVEGGGLPLTASNEEKESTFWKVKADRWDLLCHILRNVFVIRASTIRQSFSTISPGAEQVLDSIEGLESGVAPAPSTITTTDEEAEVGEVEDMGPGGVVSVVPSNEEKQKGANTKTRVVTAEMFIEIAKAYEVWPFRDKLAVWEDRLLGLEGDVKGDHAQVVRRYSANWARD